MKLTQCEQELMRRMTAMPFLDRLEMAAVSGWSKGAVYRGVRNLEDGGLAAPVPHATELTPLTISPPPGCAGWPSGRASP